VATRGDEVPRPRLGRGVRAAGLVLVALVLVGVMLRLSLWQWDRAQARHALLNYTYAVEWALFALLTVAGLARLAVEDARLARAEEDPDGQPEQQPEEQPAMARAGSPLIGPPLAPGEDLEEITWVRLRRRAGLGRR
jgi:hypothetical protein